MSIRPRKSLLDPELQRPSALTSIPRKEGQLWLDKNENLDPTLLDFTNQVLKQLPAFSIASYPEAGDLYSKIAKWVEVSPDSILLTPGSDGAIRLVFEAFIEHGDSVLHTFPTFAMYPVYSKMFGANAQTIEYSRKNDIPYLDYNIIIEYLYNLKPKLLCLPNPDSPTGSVFSQEIFEKILTTCEKVGTVLLIDEAYHPFYDWTAMPWTKTSNHLIVARTFAKAWGAAGCRIGYAVANPETINLLHKMRPMYEVSTIAVDFMTKMLDYSNEMRDSVSRILEGKTYFQNRMRDLGFNVLLNEGNFVHIAFGDKGNKIKTALNGKVYYRHNFDHISLEGYSRFSVAPTSIMKEAADLIEQAL